MKRTKYNELKAMFQDPIDINKEILKELDKTYIEQNAPYPVGTKLLVKDYGMERKVRIAYDVKNGAIVPKFKTLEGKNIFTHNPQILKEL